MALHETLGVSNWNGSAKIAHERQAAEAGRLAWADVAKGLGIFLVVLMHSTLGVGEAMHAAGWTHHIVAFAKPFRMPDFFLIGGMFASVALAQPLRRFLDRRVMHFVYFYALWVAITIPVKGFAEHGLDPAQIGRELIEAIYEPFSALWFIYVLPLMAIGLRVVHRLPAGPVLAVAAGLHVLAVYHADGGAYALSSNLTDSFSINALSLFFVFFLIGHYGRDRLMQIARAASDQPWLASALLALWAVANAMAVRSGLADNPAITLPAGIAGAVAVVMLAAVLSRLPAFSWLAYLGRKSLVIYLCFTIPMATMRILLIKSGLISDVGWVSVVTFAVALLAPLVLARLVNATALGFLFRRPDWARID